jgi:WD40 repeat protein
MVVPIQASPDVEENSWRSDERPIIELRPGQIPASSSTKCSSVGPKPVRCACTRFFVLASQRIMAWEAKLERKTEYARIVTASGDRRARIWDATTGAEIARITVDAGVTALSVHSTTIALGDALGRIHVFDAEYFLG